MRIGPFKLGIWFLGLGLVAGPLLYCFESVLFHDEQFAFRDAAHFYYPLYQVIQSEWDAGRIPLWNPWENAGMPMLGNPTAAVFYPGKLIFALTTYAWGVRLYTILHVVIAVGAMYALMRHWRVSRAGSILAGLSFGFGGPVLFQYCNIIFLVGAAWTPLGFLAVDRLVRLRRARAIVELAAVLALQTLGGDPQIGYLTGLCAGAYALGLWIASQRQTGESRRNGARFRRWAIVGLLAWVVGTLLAAYAMPWIRPKATETVPMPTFVWTPYWSKILLGIWAVVAWLAVRTWRKRPGRRSLYAILGCLAGSAVLAAMLSAAQLLPVLEFSGLTVRASREATHEIYAFSLPPLRLMELLWPNASGFGFGIESCWRSALAFDPSEKVWVYSLYLGLVPILLALTMIGWRRASAPQVLLSTLAVVSLLGSLGTYGSPIWYARQFPILAQPEWLGPLDPPNVGPIRLDGELRDGDGSPYWVLATILPGFEAFRYPSKLLTMTSLALAGLAGMGLDRLREGWSRRLQWLAMGSTILTAVLLLAIVVGRDPSISILASNSSVNSGGAFGPVDPESVWKSVVQSLAHTLVALLITVPLLRGIGRPRWQSTATALLLIVTAADLAVAGRVTIFTVPQSHFDLAERPAVLDQIERAERENPSDGPYRIHRMPAWNPAQWRLEGSPDRALEFVEWERETIQPKYGISFGVEYTETVGTAELFDILFFFAPFQRRLRPETAAMLGEEPGTRIVYYPRRGFDLWNSRYFVVPIFPGGWTDEFRGYAAFLPNTTPIYPTPEMLEQLPAEARQKMALEEDYQILRNESALPRAWVVHRLRFVDPIEGMRKQDRVALMNELLYPNDAYWSDPSLNLFDPRQVAWLEVPVEDRPVLGRFNSGASSDPSERVEFLERHPSRVVMKVNMKRAGLLVLADTFYPGWNLTVDGEAREILRTNRMMRGVALDEGEHVLVFEYQPRSFQFGLLGSGLGLLLALAILGWDRRLNETLARP